MDPEDSGEGGVLRGETALVPPTEYEASHQVTQTPRRNNQDCLSKSSMRSAVRPAPAPRSATIVDSSVAPGSRDTAIR